MRHRLPRPARPTIVVALLLLITVAGIGVGIWNLSRDDDPGSDTLFAPGPEQLPARPSVLARYIPPAARTGRTPAPVVRLARDLSTEDKVAQLFILGFQGSDATSPVIRRLSRMNLGGVLFREDNVTTPAQVRALTDEMRAVARREGHVTPLIVASQDGAEFRTFPSLPPELAPADMRNAREAARIAHRAGDALREVGMNTVLGPDVDVGAEDGGAVGARAYSDSAAEVSDFATAQVRGYRETGLVAAAKHFPGIGAASQPPDEGPATVGFSLQELRERDLAPFRAAVRAGVPAIVVGHASYAPDAFVRPASLSSIFSTDLLRGELGFQGAAIADDLAKPALTAARRIPRSAVEAVNAGADMLLLTGLPSDQDAAYEAVLRAVRSEDISEQRLDQAVRRSLSIKREMGLIR